MKTVSEIVEEYNERNEANISPLYGFTVGDKVKYTPHAIKLFGEDKRGEIIKVVDGFLTIEKGKRGSHDLIGIQEFYVMPDDTNNQTR